MEKIVQTLFAGTDPKKVDEIFNVDIVYNESTGVIRYRLQRPYTLDFYSLKINEIILELGIQQEL